MQRKIMVEDPLGGDPYEVEANADADVCPQCWFLIEAADDTRFDEDGAQVHVHHVCATCEQLAHLGDIGLVHDRRCPYCGPHVIVLVPYRVVTR